MGRDWRLGGRPRAEGGCGGPRQVDGAHPRACRRLSGEQGGGAGCPLLQKPQQRVLCTVPHGLCLLPNLVPPPGGPVWHGMHPPPPEDLSDRLPLQWPSSPDLWAPPTPNINKTHILNPTDHGGAGRGLAGVVECELFRRQDRQTWRQKVKERVTCGVWAWLGGFVPGSLGPSGSSARARGRRRERLPTQSRCGPSCPPRSCPRVPQEKHYHFKNGNKCSLLSAVLFVNQSCQSPLVLNEGELCGSHK